MAHLDIDGEIGAARRLVAGSALDAVVGINAAGEVLEWNATAEQTFGWRREEVLGRPLDRLLIPARHQAGNGESLGRLALERVGRVLNRRVEASALDKNGREFPVELSVVPLEGSAGTVFVGFIRDISSRREAEERLSLSEESLRLATEAAEIGTWDLDLATDVLTWSARTKAMFGISPGVPCSMADFYAGLHPDDREAVGEAFAAALDPTRRSTYDVQYRTIGAEDGVTRWVAAKGRGLFDQDGRCYRAVGTAIDITARKLNDERHAFMLRLSDLLRGADAERSLFDACALMGQHFAVARVGYGQLDPVEDYFDYSVCWTDGSVPDLLGRHPARAFGGKVVAKLGRGETVVVDDIQSDPLTDEPETRATAKAVNTRSILVVPFVRAGRLRTIVYLNGRTGRRWRPDEVAFMEEVAERTRQVIERGEAEAALRALNASLEARVEERTAELRATEEALRQAQKMEALGQLTGGIAHDFNNLLQGIIGSLEVVDRRLSQGRTREVKKYVEGAAASARRAAALTHRLLAFARRQPLDAKPVEPGPLITGMRVLLERTLGERIKLESSPGEGVWTVRCDANQLESALLNLAINARDAMPDGGSLRIQARNIELDALAGQFDLPAGRYVCIEVTDTGTGMSPDIAARAFEPFYTTKPLGQGTGLGLSMIYGFVRKSGGHARIRSAPGAGTTVELYLPEDSTRPDEGSAGEEAAATGDPVGGTVLVVEDEHICAASWSRSSRSSGFPSSRRSTARPAWRS